MIWNAINELSAYGLLTILTVLIVMMFRQLSARSTMVDYGESPPNLPVRPK